MTDAKKTAGGRATEAGMAFQAAVTTWFAVQMLADMPIGDRFGIRSAITMASLQCETGDALDDVVVRLEGGGAIYVQCKTRPTLTIGEDSPLAKALEQLVDLYAQRGATALTATVNVAVLAIAEDAPRSLDDLEAACRLFDHGGEWDSVKSQAPDDRRNALAVLEHHVRARWERRMVRPLAAADLVAMARLFHVQRFAENASSAEWRDTSHLLGRRLYGGDDAGGAPMASLLSLSRRFIRTGAPADRAGLLRALRAEGHDDVSAPSYDKDIEALLAYSRDERRRLRKHTRLPLGAGIPIRRDCMESLLDGVAGGSLLLTGEPGAGKTGLLLNLAERLANGTGPSLFLSMERFSGFTLRSDFRAELGLEHDPVEILAAWPGREPGVVILDALDASRGGPSEAVIAAFIADAVERVGDRWSIVASIRSFDLRNGRRFREIMPGTPPNPGFSEKGLDGVRHFHVPRLSSGELADVSAASDRLNALASTAPPELQGLLHNIFNLSLAAELLDAGMDARSIRTVATQSELIRRYEDIRLPSQHLQRAAKAAVALMVQRRRLAVRAIDIENDAIEAVRDAGVLVAAGDRIAFAHHVLFDHIAGRFYLAWDDTPALLRQLSGDPSIGLLLGPALRFALEQLWHEDGVGRPTSWRFLAALSAIADPDPVVTSIALRTAAERVEVPADVGELCDMIARATDLRSVARLISHLARFVGMATAERGDLSKSAALAWARVAQAASSTPDRLMSDATRVLLMTLAERADLTDTEVMAAFGKAARSLLAAAWSMKPESPPLAAAAIRFTARSFESNPAASRALLGDILEDRFKEHASQEAPWLAEGVTWIIPHDPAFVALVYGILFTRDVTDVGKTWVGGSASRIQPLTSTHRQDYQQARWRLNQSLRPFLAADPGAGTAAVIAAVRGLDFEKRSGRNGLPKLTVVDVVGQTIEVLDDLLTLQDWRDASHHEGEPLTAFVDFLRSCLPEAFRVAVASAAALPANAAVWARLLGVAAERPGVADDLLWPLASEPRFLVLQGLTRDAAIFLAAAYGDRPLGDRASFERGALADGLFPEGRESTWWRSVLGRFLSTVSQDSLVTPEMIALRAEMEAAGDLTGNRPFMSMTVGWSPSEDLVDRLLRSDGADLERSPDKEIRAASRKVEDDLKSSAETADVTSLASIWDHIVELLHILDAGGLDVPHAQIAQSGWGAIGNGVERLAKSRAYDPAAAGLPDLPTLLELIDRLYASPHPNSDGSSSKLMSWGNWDVRVYAASSLVALAPRFAVARPDIVDRMQAYLRDPAPTVRLQVAEAVNVLWEVARDRMWELAEEIAESETHEGIISFFIAGPLSTISQECPERCALLLSKLLERVWAIPEAGERDGHDRDAEAAANLVTLLYVARDQPQAFDWIVRWGDDLRRGQAYIFAALFSLRQAFFLPFGPSPKPSELEIADRARRTLELVVIAASKAIAQARPYLKGQRDQDVLAAWQPLYDSAHGVLDQACNQLYFGSGAFQPNGSNQNEVGLRDAQAKQLFLARFASILNVIATHAQARTVHYYIGLLSHLVEGDPTGVFDRLAAVLLEPAAEDGYQFESLGQDGLVTLVRRYLADHRDIFEDPGRRLKLVEVLDLFSAVGWPDALRLLFELPDLLR